jgi:hypothetical protein
VKDACSARPLRLFLFPFSCEMLKSQRAAEYGNILVAELDEAKRVRSILSQTTPRQRSATHSTPNHTLNLNATLAD